MLCYAMLCYAMLYHAPIAQEVHEAGDGVQLVELALVRVAAGPARTERQGSLSGKSGQVGQPSRFEAREARS